MAILAIPLPAAPNASQAAAKPLNEKGAQSSQELLDNARKGGDEVLREIGSQPAGLSAAEASSRINRYGFNEIAREKRQSGFTRLLNNVKNPLVILLSVLGAVSYLTGDLRATAVIFVMVILGVALRFIQERRADNAAEKLQAMVHTTATVVRDGQTLETPLKCWSGRHYSSCSRGYGAGGCEGVDRQGLVFEPSSADRRSAAGGKESFYYPVLTCKIRWNCQSSASWGQVS